MKKPAIPDTGGKATPDFVQRVKENIEVITGRKKNKITPVTIQTLTFSNPPTQAECQALNGYVNSIMMNVRDLLARFDD